MVDSVRLTRLLARMTDTVSELRAMIEDERSRQWLLAVKYLFIVAIEASTDVAQHVCASEGWGPPSTNADAMLDRLGDLDAFAAAIASRLSS